MLWFYGGLKIGIHTAYQNEMGLKVQDRFVHTLANIS